jgi:hypothetical protein
MQTKVCARWSTAMIHRPCLAILASLATLAACGPTDVDPHSPPALADELAAPRVFDLATGDSAIGARALALRADRESAIDLEIRSGALEVQAAGDRLVLADLEVAVADVAIPPDILPPSGVILTDLALRLGESASAEAEWTADGRRAEAAIEIDLVISWSMIRDGVVYPLADVRIRAIPIYLVVEREGGALTVSLSADREGPFWSWASTFEMRDLRLELLATSEGPPT